VKNDNQDWNSDFPIDEEVEDHAGRTRRFLFTCHQGPLGFTVRAQQQEAQGTGYEFAAYNETSPYHALGRLRQKMYSGLATRHITRSLHGYRMLHDTLSGRIASDGNGGVLVVVDGIPLSIDDLARILISHKGSSLSKLRLGTAKPGTPPFEPDHPSKADAQEGHGCGLGNGEGRRNGREPEVVED
jgi:hypothetical protein